MKINQVKLKRYMDDLQIRFDTIKNRSNPGIEDGIQLWSVLAEKNALTAIFNCLEDNS